MEDATYEGKTTGKAGVILDGSTAGTQSRQVGRFLLDSGAQPLEFYWVKYVPGAK